MNARAHRPNSGLTDEELIEQIKQGQVEMFELIVARYNKKLVNYIFRMINNYEEAMELCQDVFLKVYTSLEKYNPEYKFTTWVHRIASNATIDFLRKKRIDAFSLESSASDDAPTIGQQIAADDLSPLRSLETSQLGERIEDAINQLPYIYRQLIILRHLNELSYEEIATAVDLPLGTVKNRIFRGREMLKVALADDVRKEVSRG
ncbi:MAG: sigma-70 family RNA polymerase sigma factor [Acidobacteria bacterium]|nr:sigma-70 family RNA polymerase sigma factor [Acidobacteriota bacterium]